MKDVRVLLYFKFFNLELKNENENGGEDEKNT